MRFFAFCAFWLPSFWASVLLSQSANQGRFVACDQEPRSVVPSDRPGEGERCGSQNCISVIFQSCFILHSFQHRRTQEPSTYISQQQEQHQEPPKCGSQVVRRLSRTSRLCPLGTLYWLMINEPTFKVSLECLGAVKV